jgi:1-deoxy-D-xylulose-5-phosphate reductoisomerase
MNNLKRIAILGSTGSIGIQALDVIRKNPGLFRIELLAARRSSKLLIEQAIEFTPNAVIVIEEQAYREVKLALENFPVKVFAGRGSMIEALAWDSVDMVLNALVGFAGLEPTLAALKAGKAVALANKESLVAGGHLVMKAAFEYHAPLLPVDSEHSAIFQCLSGENATVEKLILTASGGPFFNYTRQMLEHIGKDRP